MLDLRHHPRGTMIWSAVESAPDRPAQLLYIPKTNDEERPSATPLPAPGRTCILGPKQHPSYDAAAECWEHGTDLLLVRGSRIRAILRSAQGPGPKHIALRRLQFERTTNPQWILAVSQRLISAKLRSQILVAKTCGDRGAGMPRQRAQPLVDLLPAIEKTTNLDSLRGLEGQAAQRYFAIWASIAGFPEFRRQARTGSDGLNLLLDIGYSRLARDLTLHLLDAGLDLGVGMLHVSDNKRPCLTLDLMEPLRPLIVDRWALNLWRNVATDEWFCPQVGQRPTLSRKGQREIEERWHRWTMGDGRHPALTPNLINIVTTYTQSLSQSPQEIAHHIRNPPNHQAW